MILFLSPTQLEQPYYLFLFITMADSQGPVVTAVAIVFAVITFFTITLRMWARAFVVKSLGPDDCKFS